MNQPNMKDLGFTFNLLKSGDIEIRHHGKYATKIRAKNASSTVAKLENGSFSEQQQLVARLTGNYKHSNERAAKSYSRNQQ